jgi:hypothetical protein
LQHYRQAIEFKPGWSIPLIELAWALATSPDSTLAERREAVSLGVQATRSTNIPTVAALDALAAAQASAGSYAEAVATAEEALSQARRTGDGERERQIGGRLELYRQGRPYVVRP